MLKVSHYKLSEFIHPDLPTHGGCYPMCNNSVRKTNYAACFVSTRSMFCQDILTALCVFHRCQTVDLVSRVAGNRYHITYYLEILQTKYALLYRM